MRWTFAGLVVVVSFGCTPKPPEFPPVMTKETGVGSIVAEYTRPKKTTWICDATPGIPISSVDAKADQSASLEVSGKFSAGVEGWASGEGDAKVINKVSVTLDKGTIESASSEKAVRKYDDLTPGCKNAIEMAKSQGTKYFRFVTKIYRGSVTANVDFKTDASGTAKVDALSKLNGKLEGSASQVDEKKSAIASGDAVWIIESEPYPVP